MNIPSVNKQGSNGTHSSQQNGMASQSTGGRRSMGLIMLCRPWGLHQDASDVPIQRHEYLSFILALSITPSISCRFRKFAAMNPLLVLPTRQTLLKVNNLRGDITPIVDGVLNSMLAKRLMMNSLCHHAQYQRAHCGHCCGCGFGCYLPDTRRNVSAT